MDPIARAPVEGSVLAVGLGCDVWSEPGLELLARELARFEESSEVIDDWLDPFD